MQCIDISGGSAPGPQNYIFGYGSLIEDESRESTTPSAVDAWPVRVKGLRRGWWARGGPGGMTTTFLGAIVDPAQPNASCNGVIYKVTDIELADTDRRETAGYQRCQIDPQTITMLEGSPQPPPGIYWVYLNVLTPAQLKDNLPSPQFPMVQSYVDICINGCLEVEGRYATAAGFTAEFIGTTEAWSRYWVNDRLYPRRPFIYVPNASQIDTALLAAPQTGSLVYDVELEPASWEDRKPVRPPVPAGTT